MTSRRSDRAFYFLFFVSWLLTANMALGEFWPWWRDFGRWPQPAHNALYELVFAEAVAFMAISAFYALRRRPQWDR